jgi:hypothetical protein
MVLDEKMNQTVFLVKYIINEIHIQLYPTSSDQLHQLSNLNAGFTNLDGETLVKVIKPPIVYIDISGIMLDLDHVICSLWNKIRIFF